MKKLSIVFLVLLVFGLAAVGFASAHQSSETNSSVDNTDWESPHEAMKEIMESGTYEDFEAYREEQGFKMHANIQDQEDFELMQERYTQKKAGYEENGSKSGHKGMMRGMHSQSGGFGHWQGKFSGGCQRHS